MQIYADITNCTMQVSSSSQACALGAAVSAAVISGAHRSFPAAQRAMTRVKPKSYRPIAGNRKIYDRLYAAYRKTHDALGGVDRSADLAGVMKELLALKQAQR